MSKNRNVLEKIAEALIKVGENVRGAHYMTNRSK